MNGQVDLTQFAEERYAVGQPVPRKEDPVLLRGEGRYSDDLNLPGQAHAVMVRSTAAHGIIRQIDTDSAKTLPGVLAILTTADATAAQLDWCTIRIQQNSIMFETVLRFAATDT